MNNYTCPICGYPELVEPPYDPVYALPSYDICPCCGCEFGYEDSTPSAKDIYLRNWVKQGSPWFTPELKPLGWDVEEQLRSIGINYLDLLK